MSKTVKPTPKEALEQLEQTLAVVKSSINGIELDVQSCHYQGRIMSELAVALGMQMAIFMSLNNDGKFYPEFFNSYVQGLEMQAKSMLSGIQLTHIPEPENTAEPA